MDKKILVDKLKAFIKKYEAKRDHFNLAMLLDNEPNSIESSYTLLLSSKWLDNKSPKQAVNEVLNNIINEIGVNSDEFKKISRVSVIKTKDPFVYGITSAFKTCDNTVNINNCYINGINIEKGVLFESHLPSFEKAKIRKKIA